MGRRSRLMNRDTALRYRIERIGDRTGTATFKWANEQKPALMVAAHVAISRYGRGKALTAYVIAQFKAIGRLLSPTEVCMAIDDGSVGRWIDTATPARKANPKQKARPDEIVKVERNRNGNGSRKPPEWKQTGDQIRAEKDRFAEALKVPRHNAKVEAQINEMLRKLRG